jgi:hypothetical protein
MCAAGISRPHRPALTGGLRSARARNAANLMIGSGMQQARKLQAEEAVEVVKNHVDGTRLSRWTLGSRSAAGTSRRSGRQERCRWRGERCAFRSAGRDTQMNPTREGSVSMFGAPHGALRLHDQGDRPVLQSGVKAMRVRARHVFRDVGGRGARETSKASRATGNPQGGRGKVQRPAARAPRATVNHRKVAGTLRTLKARSTAQERHPKELGLNADRIAML